MGRIITFNVTCMGASHVKNGKPCQDYSLSWQSEDNTIQVIVVCDGHGGDTYIRSDKGSELAASIALRNIQDVINYTSPDLFIDKEGAVTARPEEEDDIFHSSRRPAPDTSTYSGDDKENINVQRGIQHRKFYESVEPIRKQDQWMQELFARIYVQWIAAIEEDVENNPFTDWEKGQLNGAPVTKAYGTTLMAFARTPLYWFAFHIGDGKLLCCDAKFQWYEPVPWDCNCFLNITTSLCGREPLHSFRYAFNGKGEFPVAVIMGSDGLDDSWCTMDNLKNFYSQVLNIFNDLKEEETIKEMNEYLPRLSEKGSRDDMSMAGIIDMDAIAAGATIYKNQRELKALFSERKKQEEDIARLEQAIETARKEVSQLQTDLSAERQKKDSWLMKLSAQEKEIDSVFQRLQQSEINMAETEKKIQETRNAHEDWLQKAKVKKAELEADHNELSKACELYESEVQENWKRNKEAHLKERKAYQQQMLLEKAANMREYNDEAAKSIHEAKFEPEISDDEPETDSSAEKCEGI